MKTVFLVRHAQAVGKNKGLPDFERSLAPKGIKEARRIGRHMARAGQTPGFFISSPANRAIETAHLFAEALNYPTQKILLEDAVYDGADVTILLGLLHSVGEEYQSVALFGHDPLFSDFAHTLVPAYTQLMPKGAVLGIEFDCDRWEELSEGSGHLVYLDYPWSKTDRARLEKEARNDLADRLAAAVEETVLDMELATDGATDRVARAAGREVAARLFKGVRKQELVQRFIVRQVSEPSHESENAPSNDGTTPTE